MVSAPHYLLLAEASSSPDSGWWRFRLRSTDETNHLEESDEEPSTRGERLALLTVVRAMEALDQPSRVTLVGCSRYVRHGMTYGLPEWRDNGWRWEFFGQMVPVRDSDLWQRLDRALRFHDVEHSSRRMDAAHPQVPCPKLVRVVREEEGEATQTEDWASLKELSQEAQAIPSRVPQGVLAARDRCWRAVTIIRGLARRCRRARSS